MVVTKCHGTILICLLVACLLTRSFVIASLLNLNCICLLYYSFMDHDDDDDILVDGDNMDDARYCNDQYNNGSSTNGVCSEENVVCQTTSLGNGASASPPNPSMKYNRGEKDSGFGTVSTTSSSSGRGDETSPTQHLSTNYASMHNGTSNDYSNDFAEIVSDPNQVTELHERHAETPVDVARIQIHILSQRRRLNEWRRKRKGLLSSSSDIRSRPYKFNYCCDNKCSYPYFFLAAFIASTRILLVSINIDVFTLYSKGSIDTGGLRNDRVIFVITYAIFISTCIICLLQRSCCTTRNLFTDTSSVNKGEALIHSDRQGPQQRSVKNRGAHDVKKGKRNCLIALSFILGTAFGVLSFWLVNIMDDTNEKFARLWQESSSSGSSNGNSNNDMSTESVFEILMNPWRYQGDAYVTGFVLAPDNDVDSTRNYQDGWCHHYSDEIPVNVTVAWGGSWGCPRNPSTSCEGVTIPTKVACTFFDAYEDAYPGMAEYDYVNYRYHNNEKDQSDNGDDNDAEYDMYAFDDFNMTIPPSTGNDYWNHPSEWVLGDCRTCRAMSRPIIIEELQHKSQIAHGLFVSLGITMAFLFFPIWTLLRILISKMRTYWQQRDDNAWAKFSEQQRQPQQGRGNDASVEMQQYSSPSSAGILT